MLKKSLLWEAAVLLTAVILIFAGCEGPAGPTGNDGQDGQVGPSEIGIDGITVGVEIKEPEVILPNGFTYPDGAKVVAGDATDIALAFNGGIFVADTSDQDGSGMPDSSDYVYAQDGVDQVIWTGPGVKSASTASSLGAISVPPGKTLFIAAPLVINGTSATGAAFTGISVSDQGLLPSLSIQQANRPGEGGAKIDESSKGTLVVLAGAEITDATAAGTFTVGGNLEIHQGGSVAFTLTSITTTAGSTTRVFGTVSSASALNIGGELSIEGKGFVASGTGTAATFGKVTISGASGLSVAAATFTEAVSVAAASGVTAGGNITINDEFALDGTLSVGGNTVALANNATSHLKVSSTAGISATAWNQFILAGSGGAIDKTLLAALEESVPSTANKHITIAAATETPVFMNVGAVQASSYKNLVALAGSTTLHLEEIDGSVVTATPEELAADDLVVEKYNAVTDLTLTTLGNVTVKDGGALELGAVTSAGKVQIIGNGRSDISGLTAVSTDLDAVVFGTRLESLTIGDDAGTETAVSLDAATLASTQYTDSAIIVNKNATLTLNPALGTAGPPITGEVDPPGSITLAAEDTTKALPGGVLTIAGGTSTFTPFVTFDNLKKLEIEKGAVFNAYNATSAITTITFAKLTKLTVDGELNVPQSNVTFAALEAEIGTNDGSGYDVKGEGIADLSAWEIDGTANIHAFDQLLGIKELRVAELVGITKVSGTDGTVNGTPDRFPVTDADGAFLVVKTKVEIAAGADLLIDRDLVLTDSAKIHFLGANSTLSFPALASNGKPKGIYTNVGTAVGGVTTYLEKGILALGGSIDTTNQEKAVLSSSDTIDFEPGTTDGTILVTSAASAPVLNLKQGTLLVPGTFGVNAGTVTLGPSATGKVTLGAGTKLTKGSLNNAYDGGDIDTAITSAMINVENGGALTLGTGNIFAITAPATDAPVSGIQVKTGGKIDIPVGAGSTLGGITGFLTNAASPATAISSLTAIAKAIPAGAAAVTVSTIKVTGAAEITLDGAFNGTGPTPLSVPNSSKVILKGSLTARKNGYDYAGLNGVTISTTASNLAAFKGDTSSIEIGGTLIGDAANANVITSGTGVFFTGTSAAKKMILYTKGDNQSLNGVNFTQDGIDAGTLVLTGSSELTFNAATTLGGGAASAGVTFSGSATVKIAPSAGAGIAVTITDKQAGFGKFSNGNGFTITGKDGNVDSTLDELIGGTGNVQSGPFATGTVDSNHIVGAFGPITSVTPITGGNAAVLSVSKITGSTAGNTFTSATRIYTTN